ncbi:MAG: zinc-ribbon domain-containing protein [Clostridia bacterium]|nr:zinc-ribbon domain-containing protein [Clostridia bacterium]
MNCPKCGNELKPNMKFCAKCGTPVQQSAVSIEQPAAPAQPKPVAPAPSKETAQPAPKTEPQKPAKQKKAKKKSGKKNIALRIITIILVLAVLATGGIFITDAILFKTESEKEGYITDFPVLKQDTEFLVYDAEKFPYENYNIKVDRFKTGKVFKSSTFSGFENVINEKSDNPIYNLHLDDGKYQITIENIISERTQAPSTTTTAPTTPTTPTTPSNTQTTTTTAKTEEPVVITIIVIVDNDDKDAVDKVTINSKKDDEPIKDWESYKNDSEDVTNSSSQKNPDFIMATDADFEELSKLIIATELTRYEFLEFDSATASAKWVVENTIFSYWLNGYTFFYGRPDFSQKMEGPLADEYNSDWYNYCKVPEENVKWICENIYNIKYESLKEGELLETTVPCCLYNGYYYCGSPNFGDGGWEEHELVDYKVVEGKYEVVWNRYACSDYLGRRLEGAFKVTAEIKIIDGKRYWSIYKIEEYDPESATPSTQTPSNNTSTGIGNVKVGDYVKFGKYEQDNNTSNGAEDIEWLVLDVKDGKALVISKYALDAKPYNEEYVDVTWETCTLRKWLNNDFINTAFTNAEKAKIPTVTVTAEKNQYYGTDPGNVTKDKVFLLSANEATKYFSSDTARECEPTDFAVANSVSTDNDNGYDCCWWWLRSPGYDQSGAAGVTSSGGVFDATGNDVNFYESGVRPAMWINIG